MSLFDFARLVAHPTGDGNAATKAYANGGVTLKYSCDALAAAVGQVRYTVRLGWRREY